MAQVTRMETSNENPRLRTNQIKFIGVPGKAMLRGDFRNFRGEKTQYNNEGNRVFSFEIDPEFANELEVNGWTIKRSKPREDGKEYLPRLQVRVNRYATSAHAFGCKIFEQYPGETKAYFVPEDEIGKFDKSVEIESFTAVINGYMNQFGRYSCYLDTLVVQIAAGVLDDEFELVGPRGSSTEDQKSENLSPLTSDELPF